MWSLLTAHAPTFWKLAGKGSLQLDAQGVILTGLRPRLFRRGVEQRLGVPFGNIFNVLQVGRLVQCRVRIPDGAAVELKVWAADEDAARHIAVVLPKERSAQFESEINEHRTFAASLQSLGSLAPVTPALIVLNCAVFAATVMGGAGLLNANASRLIQWGTNYGPLTLDGQWWRLFSSMFLHFGLLHLALNMWALLSIGRLTERLFGSLHYLTIYVFAGLCGSIASLLWHPDVNSAGASGAIFGVLGGLLAFMVNPRTRLPASVAAPQRNSALVFVAYNLFNGFSHAGIDNACHIGGLLGGFAMGWWLARPTDAEARRAPAHRLLAGILAGIAALIALSWPLVHPGGTVRADRHFRNQLAIYAVNEEALIASQNSLSKLLTEKKITAREWGLRQARDVMPRWKSAEEPLRAADLPPQSRLFPLRKLLLEYLDEKLQVLGLLSDAARTDDGEVPDTTTALAAQNQVHAARIKELIRKVY